jgi:hypothetical protein
MNSFLRRKRLLVICSCLLVIVASLEGAAQDTRKPLTNSDIIEMTKGGLPESTIVLAIQKGPTQFETSAQTLIQLKNQGVSPRVLDTMIQAGTLAPDTIQQPNTVRRTSISDPMGGGSMINLPTTSVVLVDGGTRTNMKYSSPDMRTNSMMGAVVNPFHKSRIRNALKGNHAQLRTKNTSPVFEVGVAADANPSDVVALVKLTTKSDTRQIETGRGSITGVSSGFRKEDLLPVSLDELVAAGTSTRKVYRVRLVNALPPGEYALVYGGAAYYDFGVDAN